METYETLLKSAYKSLPEKKEDSSRFEIPKVSMLIQGNKTIISNFLKIAEILRREPQHMLKYLQRELAAPAYIDGPRLILNRKIFASQINQKIEQYANDFVLCYECKKPDTIIKKEDRVMKIKCMACGAKHPVKSKI
ncbi:translation initiation factor IF-2 subunit beta [archaeon]|nr:translation initiation factor IF-2 subunit beta [archaeon]